MPTEPKQPSQGTTVAGPGRFVVLEGLDGTGTTTVAGLLVEALQARDLRVHLTAEPTDGPFGRLLRRHLSGEVTLPPVAATLAFTADRQHHLMARIRPALARGRWVVSDRYLLSTLAYQGAEGIDPEAILAASAGFEVPDVTFVLDVGEELRRERMSGRAVEERYEAAALSEGLRASYERAIALLRARGDRIETIDASVGAPDVRDAVLARLDAGA